MVYLFDSCRISYNSRVYIGDNTVLTPSGTTLLFVSGKFHFVEKLDQLMIYKQEQLHWNNYIFRISKATDIIMNPVNQDTSIVREEPISWEEVCQIISEFQPINVT